jgi:hypothetical protein
MAHKTHDEDKEHNTICVGHYYMETNTNNVITHRNTCIPYIYFPGVKLWQNLVIKDLVL